jgi:hypothetical protein
VECHKEFHSLGRGTMEAAHAAQWLFFLTEARPLLRAVGAPRNEESFISESVLGGGGQGGL